MGRKSEYKPLLFTTTLRNPERIKNFLEVLARYEGEILTNEVINKIVWNKKKIILLGAILSIVLNLMMTTSTEFLYFQF